MPKQSRKVLELYGMNLVNGSNGSKVNKLLKRPGEFASLQEVAPTNNPMIRAGFKNKEQLNAFKIGHTENISLPIQNSSLKEVIIQPQEKIASIMLSSVGGDDSLNYAERIATIFDSSTQKYNYDQIFIFCGNNGELKSRLEKLQTKLLGRAHWLGLPPPKPFILLGPQDDTHVAQILTRSDLSILRGGVIIMEELALDHHKEQKYFFHHTLDEKNKLTTGLSWEDASIQYFIKKMHQSHQVASAGAGTVDNLHTILGSHNVPTSTDYLLSELDLRLDGLKKKCKKVTLSPELTTAFIKLMEQLHAELTLQKYQEDTDRELNLKETYRLTRETINFFDNLIHISKDGANIDNKDALLKLTQQYDKNCHMIAKNSRFAKSVVALIAAAVGFALGLVIGGAIGILLGLWTGPGAVVTAIAGLSTGAATGAGIGLMLTGTASSIATGCLSVKQAFFTPKLIEKAQKDIIEQLMQANNAGG